LIFDEATSSLDSATAEYFTATINQLKGRVTMLFITHAVPKNLQVDEIVRIADATPTSLHEGKSGSVR
jgi:ATP-binding cassette, subfamily B, bacterial HlyB/CyaB